MKTKFKKNGRRLLAAILCLVMAVMALPMSAFAWTSEEGVSCTSSFGDYYVGSDGGYYRSKSSYSFIVYDSDGNTSVRTISAGNAKRKYLMTDSSGTHQVYCVESGIDFNTGNSYVSQNGKNSSYFRKLPTEAQFGVMMALMYGWHEGKSSPVAGTNTDDYAFATQTIIWEYQQQLRTSPSDLHSANGIDADTYRYSLKGRPAEKCYDWILSQMASHYIIPSFAARNQSKADTYTLKYNPDRKNYSLTLTDTNNTLANLSLSASGIKVSRSGNQYTFTSDKMITSPITVSAQKAVNLDCDEMLIWGCVGKQTMVSGASDPVYFYFKIDTETYGTGLIKKTSEDGVVSGIKFNISGNGVNQTVVTKADGTVDISLMPGVYTVTEQPIDRYEPQSVQRITIVSGHTSTVTFSNTLKRGSLEIIKSSEDNLVEGVKFHLYGTSLSGLPVDEYAVTDANGVARFENVLISGATPYTVEEIDTAVRYVIPASQTAPIEWEKVTSRSFTNILKKFNVTVTKSDAEMGTAQGDASLAGAVYGIYKGEELIDTYTTDKNGQFTTKYYVCGNDWTVREISPSEGYLLDKTIHKVGAEPELYTVEFNSTANDVTEQVIKGNIAIIKHTDNGETQIETPETGAAFEVFLKAAGSFDAAEETERDILTCDENGFAQTKNMPYGILGYDRVGDTYVINEEQAETVRMIFDLYLQGFGSMKIAQILTERKRKTATGLIKWSVSNIMRAIKNATYTGTKCYNKSRSNNFLEQKRINNLDMSTYEYVEGDFPAIVSQEIWDKAQAIRENRMKPALVSAEKTTHSKRDSRDIWVNKLRCSCGSSYRKNKWHTKLDGKTSYGYQCYNQLNNGIRRKRAEIGLDTEGYCDSRMITDWKLDFMAKALLEHLWQERKESVLIALDLIRHYYKEERTLDNKSDAASIQARIDKANSRLANLIAMRADGEISKDEYQSMRSPIDKEIKELQKALEDTPTNKGCPRGLDLEGIRSTLNSLIDFSGSTISHDVINQFVYMVTPTSDTTFDWYVNLNGTADVKATFTAEGRKKSCIIKLEEIEKISSVHRKENEDNAHLIKNPIVFAFLHRLLLRSRETSN